MKFDEYQDLTSKTAIYPEVGTGSLIALNYCALGLSEAGEVQGKVKKIWRDDDGVITDEKRAAILGELGDVLWYVSQAASELNSSLSDIAQANIDKLFDRRARGVVGGSGDNR
jgi:NTP pyrophosphatase (non-canonical NTP hydrolase)